MGKRWIWTSLLGTAFSLSFLHGSFPVQESFKDAFDRSQSLIMAGELDSALATSHRLVTSYPESPDARLMRGRLLAWTDNLPAAEVDLRWVVEHFQDYADAWRALGDVLRWGNDFTGAVNSYNRSVKLEPIGAVYLALAQAHTALGDLSEARRSYQRAAEYNVDPGKIEAAIAALDAKANAAAQPAEADSLPPPPPAQTNPQESFSNRFDRGRSLIKAGLLDSALATFNRLVRSYPESPDARLMRGRLLGWSGDRLAAEVDLRWITERFPDYSDAWRALGDVLRWGGNMAGAAESYQRSAKLEPSGVIFLALAKAQTALGELVSARKNLNLAEKNGADKGDIGAVLSLLATQPTAVPWQARMAYSRSKLPFDTWDESVVLVSRKIARGTLILDGRSVTRFGKTARPLALEAYHLLWNGAYGHVRILAQGGGEIVPDRDITIDVTQAVGIGNELSAGFRYMTFPGKEFWLLTLGAARYQGPFYLRATGSRVSGTGTDGVSAMAQVRYYVKGVDNFIELTAGSGRSLVRVGTGDRVYTYDTSFISSRSQIFFLPFLGLDLRLGYNDEQVYDYNVWEVGLVYRW